MVLKLKEISVFVILLVLYIVFYVLFFSQFLGM